MSLVFDRRDQYNYAGGTHALICGISAYPHLVGGSGDLTPHNYDLPQLKSAARTAHAVYSWLLEHADDLVPPLASCRLLIAPTPGELPPDVTCTGVIFSGTVQIND